MTRRLIATIAIVLFASMVFSGCPGQGSAIAGIWALGLDEDCNAGVGYQLAALYSDGTAEWFTNTVIPGTWVINGSTIMVTFPAGATVAYVFTGTINADTISNGTYTIDGMGGHCWTAQRETY